MYQDTPPDPIETPIYFNQDIPPCPRCYKPNDDAISSEFKLDSERDITDVKWECYYCGFTYWDSEYRITNPRLLETYRSDQPTCRNCGTGGPHLFKGWKIEDKIGALLYQCQGCNQPLTTIVLLEVKSVSIRIEDPQIQILFEGGLRCEKCSSMGPHTQVGWSIIGNKGYMLFSCKDCRSDILVSTYLPGLS